MHMRLQMLSCSPILRRTLGEGEEGEQVWLPSGAPVFFSLTQPHSGVRVLPLFFQCLLVDY